MKRTSPQKPQRIVAQLGAGASPSIILGSANPRLRTPLYDAHPLTGISIEVFYADRSMETFGRSGAGWFWWARRRGHSPDGPASGPFATSYAAYRQAMKSPTPVFS